MRCILQKAGLFIGCILFCLKIFAQSWEEQSLNGTPRTTVCTRLLDWDGDGDLDILGLENTGHLVWYKNNSTRLFLPEVILDHHLEHPQRFEVVDFDHNGKKDILVIATGITWFQQQMDGTFIQWTIKPNRKIFSYQLIDLNRDGHTDVLASFKKGQDEGRVAFFLNDGKGNFSEMPMPNSERTEQVRAGDLNHDGYIDIVTCLGPNHTELQVLYGKPDLQFDPNRKMLYNRGDRIDDFRLEDYNSDGKLDISFILYYPTHDLMLLDGSKDFKINPDFRISPLYNWATSGKSLPVDFDQNGVLDYLFIEDSERGGVQIRHYPDRQLKTIDYGFGPTEGSVMTTGDLDGDGDLDIVCTVNPEAEARMVWFENINGTFHEHKIYGAYEEILSVKITDYDLDGDEDIFFSCADENLKWSHRNGVYLLENRGKGVYESWFVMPLYHEQDGVLYQDIDQDGDLDIIGVSSTEHRIYVCENNRAPHAWAVKNVVPKNAADKISAFASADAFYLLNWNTDETKLDIYSKPKYGDQYIKTSLDSGLGEITHAEIISTNPLGKINLLVINQDTAEALSVFEFSVSDHWNLTAKYSFEGYTDITVHPLLGKNNQKYFVFTAEKAKKQGIFVLFYPGEKFKVHSIYTFEQRDWPPPSYMISNLGDELFFTDDDDCYKINLNEHTFQVVKQNLPKRPEGIDVSAFAIEKVQNDEVQQFIRVLEDGYISFFRKKP